MTVRLGGTLGLLVIAALIGCSDDRTPEGSPSPVTFRSDVGPLFAQKCASCHSGPLAQGGWRADSYLGAIACVGDAGAVPAALPSDDRAPLLRALDMDTHRPLLTNDERERLRAWIAGGAPAFRGTVHAPGIVDPRSPDFHGKRLRDARWTPMLDPNDANACGRCHEGAPARPPGITSAAPGATACTSCHAEPNGVLACSTCHGSATSAAPPRNSCFFPEDAARAGAHAAHADVDRTRFGALSAPLACATCHPAPVVDPAQPGLGILRGTHGNGAVEIAFDKNVAGASASYDPQSGACAVACHDRGGARPRPAWHDAVSAPLGCNDCHRAPPPNHFPGPCTTCHHEANATGTGLTFVAGRAALHVNGRVDLGDGSGKCGACHGAGDDPFPRTAAHPAHESPQLTTPVACTTCHAVPSTLLAPGHMNGVVEVALSGRARDRGATATFANGTCTDVACHGARLVDPPAVTPVWKDTSGRAGACGSCHGIPPSQHTASTSCDRSTCHGAEVARSANGTLSITDAGRTVHVNGAIDTAFAP